MAFPPAVQKLVLTAHVTASVGWLGAVATFLALAIAGLRTQDTGTVQGAYIAMDVVARWAILPASLASLATGVVMSLVSRWGLLQHYWVVAKLGINLASTLLLLLHMRPIATLSEAARGGDATALAAHAGVATQMAVDSALAVVALVLAVVLSVYKPRGLTRRGWRLQRERGVASDARDGA